MQLPSLTLALLYVGNDAVFPPGTPVSVQRKEIAKNTDDNTVRILPMLCTLAAEGLMRAPPVSGRFPDASVVMPGKISRSLGGMSVLRAVGNRRPQLTALTFPCRVHCCLAPLDERAIVCHVYEPPPCDRLHTYNMVHFSKCAST